MKLFDEIKEHLSIVDVVSEYVTLKKIGSYYKGVCPLHYEKTASFTVTPHKEIFYCFGCRQGGDVISFMSAMEKCTPFEAARHLAQRYNIPVSLETQDALHGAGWSEQQKHYALCEAIATWCHAQLASAAEPRAYLEQRTISEASRTRYTLGYMPGGERARKQLLAFLQKQTFLMDDLLAIKFFMSNKQGAYSPFEERIIFPIRDALGRTCGFGGRIFAPHDERAKYYNSHEHAQFSKGALLFGLDLAKRHIQQTNMVYLVEGYTDCIALAQAGCHHAVATLGTACTGEHLKLLGRYTTHLRVMYDNDAAGIEASLKLGQLCWKEGLELFVVQLPKGLDPASYSEQGGLLGQLPVTDIISFYLASIQERFQVYTLAEKLTAIKELLARIATVPDRLKQELLLEQIAHISKVHHATLARELRRLDEGEKKPAPLRVFNLAMRKDLSGLEAILFGVLLNGEIDFADEERKMVRLLLPGILQGVFDRLQAFKTSAAFYRFSDFFATLNEEERELVTKLIVSVPNVPQHEEQIQDLLAQCRLKYWKYAVHLVKEQLRHAQQAHDTVRIAELMKKFDNLKKSLQYKGVL